MDIGGEWWFKVIVDNSEVFCLDNYQNVLIEIKQEYKPTMPHETEKSNVQVSWFEKTDSEVEPPYNIFATFKTGDQEWKLFWNPQAVGWQDERSSNLNTRRAPGHFKAASIKIQKLLCTKFPKHFQLYLGDGPSGYGPESDEYFGVTPDGRGDNFDWDDDHRYNGDNSDWDDERYNGYNRDSEEEDDRRYGAKDFAACSLDDCGYCGRCHY